MDEKPVTDVRIVDVPFGVVLKVVASAVFCLFVIGLFVVPVLMIALEFLSRD